MTSLPKQLRDMHYRGKPLSPAETRLLKIMAQGSTSVEAARRLGVSKETAKEQLAVARSKLGARTTAQAIATAVAEELI